MLAGRPAMPTKLGPMKLVFLHGSPAVGKLTVAKALLRLVPGRLIDNHAAIDLARTVFDFGAPGFWELVHASRCAALRAAGEHDVPLLAMTFCYADPHDQANFADFQAITRQHAASCFLYSCIARARKPHGESATPTGSSGAS